MPSIRNCSLTHLRSHERNGLTLGLSWKRAAKRAVENWRQTSNFRDISATVR